MGFNDNVLTALGSTSLHNYAHQHRDRVKILQLLVESEITRLKVWCNPGNDPGRGVVSASNLEKTMTSVGLTKNRAADACQDEWSRLTARAWTLSPSMAVHMGERFKQPGVQNEISRLVRGNPKAVVDVPEALHYLLGDGLNQANIKSLKASRAGEYVTRVMLISPQWLPVWAAVPPVTALAYFQPRFRSHPLIIQYAMRILEQYPVEVTFFFVPQVVQGLRVDQSGERLEDERVW